MHQILRAPALPAWSPLGVGGTPPPSTAGFAWDYVDLLDGHGSGVVLIWADGLPFVPGTVGAGRAGRPVPFGMEPSVSVAVYERGRCTAWCLHVFSPSERRGSRLGECAFRGGPGALDVQLDLPIPGGPRLRGRLETRGAPIALNAAGESVHRWAPRSIGLGHASLSCGRWGVDLAGRVYHDRNASAVGLEALGIRRWFWGRTPHPEGDRVHYVLEPVSRERDLEAWAVDLRLDGAATARRATAITGPERRGRWGLRAPAWIEVDGVRTEHTHALEDGPFYQRWATRTSGPGGALGGVGEVVDVGRMDRGPFGPLVRMAVRRPGGSSPFLPLFCGPRSGRLARLGRAWMAR